MERDKYNKGKERKVDILLIKNNHMSYYWGENKNCVFQSYTNDFFLYNHVVNKI